MGLFTFLKNGLTIEKKKNEAVIDETPAEQPATEALPEPTPVPEQPAPIIEETPADKKKLAEYILYGSTNPAPTPAIETPQPTPAPVQQTYNAYSNVSANFNNALMGPTAANQNLLVISPKSADEISAILSNLASGNACIVSLANISDAQRHLDYICGFMNAIGGTIMQRTQTEYILTPKGVGIKS